MRLYNIVLLLSCIGLSWAQSPSPESSTRKVETSTTADTTTKRNEFEHYERIKNDFIQKQKALYEELKADHELCLTGDQRSPVDLDFVSALPAYLPGIEFVNYDSTGKLEELPSNHTEALCGFNLWKNAPYIRGGDLDGEYILWEFHQNEFHSKNGADGQVAHSVNRAFYDFEAHFVHVKRGMTLDEARDVPGAITIVAIEYKRNHTIFKLSEPETHRKNLEPITLDKWIEPRTLIPKNTESFFTYNGSLPHSPCTPGINWIILADPVHINDDLFEQIFLNDKEKYNLIAKVAAAPTIGNRTVLFNFGLKKNPSGNQGYSIYTLIILAITTAAATWVGWFLVEKYCKKPIENGYVKYFVNNNT